MAAGGVIEVIDAVYLGMIQNGFCIVWPPGHHAHSSMASGFCFYNNVANGAKYAQKKYGAKKIVIFDWDVHFGDGTSEILLEDDSILFISIHWYDCGKFYPGGKSGSAKNIG